MTDKIISRPATDEYRDGYERIFGAKGASWKDLIKRTKERAYYIDEDGIYRFADEPHVYDYVTYEIEGATRTPEMGEALERSMRPAS